MYPIIVLDGPDGSGKTTLGEQLVKDLGAKYLHLTYRWGAKMHLYHQAALFYVLREAQTRPVVLDRWWMSELVYANVYRGGSKWPLMYRMLEKAAVRHSIIYVSCRPRDRDAYMDHFHKLRSERDEMYFDNMEKVWDGYHLIDQMMDFIGHPHIMFYDWMTQGCNIKGYAKSIYEFAYDKITDNYSVNQVPIDHMNLAGSWNYAKYALIGDKLKPKTRREVWPFFEYGHSSLWLMETLAKLEIPEHDLIHINANHHDQEQTNANIKKAKDKGLKIISMGSAAHGHLLQMGIGPDARVNHPQAYARFNREQGLIDLKEALT